MEKLPIALTNTIFRILDKVLPKELNNKFKILILLVIFRLDILNKKAQ